VIFGLGATDADAASAYKIEVNKATNTLTLYKNGRVYKQYPVATGRNPSLTPEGTFPVVVKFVKPGWKGIPGGLPENPLGERWLGISVKGDNGRTYGIHGTNQPSSIGKYVSNGCIRMHNKDVIELYNLVPTGTPVHIHSGKKGGTTPKVKPASGQLKVSVNRANIRSGPSLSASILKQAARGTVLTRTGTSNDWHQIRLPNGKKAYVHDSVVRLVSGGSKGQFRKASGKLVIDVWLANVRSAPSLKAPVMQRLAEGKKLNLTGESKDWYRIRLASGKTAYVHKSVAVKR
jgi:SH3-like domain-containing protein